MKVLFVWIMLLLPGGGEPEPALEHWRAWCARQHAEASFEAVPGVTVLNGMPVPDMTARCIVPAPAKPAGRKGSA
jgi:hypothetical protein